MECKVHTAVDGAHALWTEFRSGNLDGNKNYVFLSINICLKLSIAFHFDSTNGIINIAQGLFTRRYVGQRPMVLKGGIPFQSQSSLGRASLHTCISKLALNMAQLLIHWLSSLPGMEYP